MVETITPMVHGGSRSRWAVALALHSLGSTTVAAVFGAAVAGVGRTLGAPWHGAWWPVVALVAFAAAAHELAATPFPIPQLRRQVPDWWRTFFGPYVAAALYGGALGVGFLTFVTRATLVVVAAAVAASGEPQLGAALMAPFGFARGVGAIAAGWSRDDVIGRLARIGAGRLLPSANASAVVLIGVAAVLARPRFDAAGGTHLAASLVAVTFAWSAAWKLLRPSAWRRVLATHRLGTLERLARVGVPAAESGVVVLYALGRPDAGVAVAAGLAVAGTAAVIRARFVLGPRIACGCFGEGVADYRVALARNLVVLLASVGVLASPAPSRPSLALPGADDVAPIAISVVGCLALAWCFAAAWRAMRRPQAAS